MIRTIKLPGRGITIDVESLPKGTKVVFTSKRLRKQYEGLIQVEGNSRYLCQDVADGIDCRDKLGFRHSWKLANDSGGARLPDEYFMSNEHEVKFDIGTDQCTLPAGWADEDISEIDQLNSSILENYYTL